MSTTPAVDRPTASIDPYYSYRITLPHALASVLTALFDYHSSDWCAVMHFPDDEKHCMKEHFHIAFRDFDLKKVDNLKKKVAKLTDAKGNALHAGKFWSNHISEAVGYFKHQAGCKYIHTPQPDWDILIRDTPAFVKSDDGTPILKGRPEKLGDPTLTHSNVIKQAVKFQAQHMPSETSLQNVLSRMVHQSNWVPSRDLLRNGVPREFHEMFHDRVSKRQRIYAWMAPHVPSEDKAKWLDRPDTEPILAGIVGTCPGNSQKLWTGKDMREPKEPPPPSI